MSVEIMLNLGTIIIAFIALIVSITVALSNRKTLQVEFPANLISIEEGATYFQKDNGELEVYGACLVATVEVVNPSPKDIAFFDLRAYDSIDGSNMRLLTRRAMLDIYRNKTLWRLIESPEGYVTLKEQNIPEKDHGIYLANSFTRYNIIMFPNEKAQELILSFKVAIRSKFTLNKERNFRMYDKKYIINNWREKEIKISESKL